MGDGAGDEPRAGRWSRPIDRARGASRLDEVLGETFADAPDRAAVLVVGAGLLREMLESERRSAWIEPDRRWGSFVSWGALRRRVAASGDGREPWVMAAKLLDPPAAHEMTLMQLGYRLREARFRDIVTLDVDTTIEAALRSVGFVQRLDDPVASATGVETRATQARALDPAWLAQRRLEARSTLVSLDGEQTIRVWHPRGSVLEPETIRLDREDVHATRGVLERAFTGHNSRRSELSQHVPEASRGAAGALREALRARETGPLAAADSPLRTWVDLFASSDLVFAGARLARTELDLWGALALRSRTSAAVGSSPGLRALYLATEGSASAHVLANDVGLDLVEFASHRGLWDAVLRPVEGR